MPLVSMTKILTSETILSTYVFQISQYDLELTPDLDPNSNFTTDGKVWIHFNTSEKLEFSSKRIAVHAKQLIIKARILNLIGWLL